MANVRLTNVRKVYANGHEAVRGVSLEIADGAMVVLLGPSGCGKSTLLRLIAGLEALTAGEIEIGGKVVNGVAPKDRDIAMVFQSYALYPHMSVRGNMAFALKNRRTPKAEIERRVREAARLLEIEDVLDRKPRQLSGGQRQRVALGRAIVREPRVFLFDEPLSNLDARLRLSTRAELKALHRRLRTTTIHVTHDQEEAMSLGDVVVVMSEGVVQQAGPPLEVYRRPANRFVAGFVGSPAMNFLEGRVERGEFVSKGVRLALPEAWGAGERQAVLGVRPGSIRPVGSAGAVGPVVRMRVEVVEPLGEVSDVVGILDGGQRVVSRAAGEVRVGEEAAFAWDLAQGHLFEAGGEGTRLF